MRASMRRTSFSRSTAMSFFSTPGTSITTMRASSVSWMSVLGTKWRAGTGFFSFVTRSFFFRASRSCDDLCIGHLLIFGSAQLDGFGFVALGPRQVQGQDPVAAFGLDLLRVYFDGERYCTVKSTGEPLAAMNGTLFAIADRLRAGDPERSALDLDLRSEE